LFGFSFAKILVLAVVVIGAWRFFKWLERRADAGPKPPQTGGHQRDAGNPTPLADATNDDPNAVELEQDPETGVWRPKK
jgi:hypothetical protein